MNDEFEREADAVAEQIMRMPDGPPTPSAASPSSLQRACACGGNGEGECTECAAKRMQLKVPSPAGEGGMEAPDIVHEALRLLIVEATQQSSSGFTPRRRHRLH